MHLLPPSSNRTHWVYDDPSGVADKAPAAPIPFEKPKRGTLIPFPLTPKPATPKAA